MNSWVTCDIVKHTWVLWYVWRLLIWDKKGRRESSANDPNMSQGTHMGRLNSCLTKDLSTWPFKCLERYPKTPLLTMACDIRHNHLQNDTSNPWQHCSTHSFIKNGRGQLSQGRPPPKNFATPCAIDISKRPVNFDQICQRSS